jgi:uncharacterized protein YaeQ
LQAPGVRQKLILVKDELEQRAHVVMKLMSFLLFFDPRLKIETDVGMHYKPDLAVLRDDGIPELWIDCGKIALRKVESLAFKLRRTRIVLVKETRAEMERFKKLIDKKVEYGERVQYLSFDPGFISGIAGSLARMNQVTLYEVTPGVIGLALNDQVFESALHS